jgi:Tat protein secretion system quality control protein TatD with DNase activity
VNEPAFVTLTASRLAELKEVPLADLAARLYLNAHMLFARREVGTGE